MKLIIAGNYRQYLDYITKAGLSRREAIHAWRREDYLGLRDVEVITTGEFWLNPLADHLDEIRLYLGRNILGTPPQ